MGHTEKSSEMVGHWKGWNCVEGNDGTGHWGQDVMVLVRGIRWLYDTEAHMTLAICSRQCNNYNS